MTNSDISVVLGTAAPMSTVADPVKLTTPKSVGSANVSAGEKVPVNGITTGGIDPVMVLSMVIVPDRSIFEFVPGVPNGGNAVNVVFPETSMDSISIAGGLVIVACRVEGVLLLSPFMDSEDSVGLLN